MLLLIAALLLPITPSASANYSSDPNFPRIRARQVSAPSGWQKLLAALRGEADLTVKVLDAEGRALGGASVMVGQAKGDPFAGNVAISDAEGNARFSDEALRGGARFTISAVKKGYSAVMLSLAAGGEVELGLPKLPAERDFGFVSGSVSGFPTGYGSKELELGLFLPAFRPESLANFDPQQFISTYKEKIDLYGEREVPGNVVFPPQRKRYGLLPISLSKPTFTMPLPKGLSAHMAALSGAVGISGAVDAIKKKDFLGALNLASFARAGWSTRPLEVNGDERIDITLSQEVVPGAITARLSGVPAKADAVSISLFDPGAEREDFAPLDVKALKSEEIGGGSGTLKLGGLKARAKDRFYAFTGLFDRAIFDDKNASSRWIVASLQPVSTSKSEARFPAFLRPIKTGSTDSRVFHFGSAANGALAPDFILLNLVSEKKNELTNGVTRRLVWQAALPGDATDFTLPEIGRFARAPARGRAGETYLWEVIAVKAGASALHGDLDIQSQIRDLEHVSTFSQKL